MGHHSDLDRYMTYPNTKGQQENILGRLPRDLWHLWAKCMGKEVQGLRQVACAGPCRGADGAPGSVQCTFHSVRVPGGRREKRLSAGEGVLSSQRTHFLPQGEFVRRNKEHTIRLRVITYHCSAWRSACMSMGTGLCCSHYHSWVLYHNKGGKRSDMIYLHFIFYITETFHQGGVDFLYPL